MVVGGLVPSIVWVFMVGGVALGATARYRWVTVWIGLVGFVVGLVVAGYASGTPPLGGSMSAKLFDQIAVGLGFVGFYLSYGIGWATERYGRSDRRDALASRP